MLENVQIKLDDFKIENLNLNLDNGEICFLFGPNGSGKTSILNAISGEIEITSGKIARPNNIFYLPANPILDLSLKSFDVFDILDCNLDLKKSLISEFELEGIRNKTVGLLSSGEYKRLWVVAALSYKADCYLLDEPLVYLDLMFQYKLRQIIKKLISNKRFLIATHNFNWCLGFEDATSVILNNTLSKKEPIIRSLEGSVFQNTFKLSSKVSDSPLDGALMLATSKKVFNGQISQK